MEGPGGEYQDDQDRTVVALGWNLRERLALQTARRILTEISAHDKLGDDSYHDVVIDLARSWVELYG
jgi:hypothetical protein